MGKRLPFHQIKYQWLDLLDADLSLRDGAARVGRYIARFIHRDSEKAWPSYQTIAKALGRSIKSVQRAVKELETQGWLTVDRGNGCQKSTVYRPTEATILAAIKQRQNADKYVLLKLLQGEQNSPERRTYPSNQSGQICPPTKEIDLNKTKGATTSQKPSSANPVFISMANDSALQALAGLAFQKRFFLPAKIRVSRPTWIGGRVFLPKSDPATNTSGGSPL